MTGVDATTSVAQPPPVGAARWSLLRSTAVLGAALMAANAANYLLAVAGSHRLSTSSYGLLSAMLAVLLVASIPALALQAVVARRTAAGHFGIRRGLRLGIVTGACSVALGFAALPGLTVFLHVPHHGAAVAWTVVGLLPLSVLAASQGHLQGQEAFGRLSLLVLAVGLSRIVGGLLPLVAGGGPTWVMAGITISTAAVALGAMRLASGDTAAAAVADRSVAPEVVAASLSLGALLLLSSLDLLLARHLLSSTASGRYAAGNVVAKVAFWLPQAVPLTALPRLSRDTARERALREAMALTALVGVASVAVTAAFGPTLTRLTFGPGYAGIGHIAWRFALQGAALAAVQLLVIDDIANRRRRTVPMILVAAAVETVVLLVVSPHTPRHIISIAMVVAVLLMVTGVVMERLRRD